MLRRRLRLGPRLSDARPLAILQEYSETDNHVLKLGPLICGTLVLSPALQDLIETRVRFTWDQCICALHRDHNFASKTCVLSKPTIRCADRSDDLPTIPSLLLSALKHCLRTLDTRLLSRSSASERPKRYRISDKWTHRIVYLLKTYRSLNTFLELHSYFQFNLIEGIISALFDCKILTKADQDALRQLPINILAKDSLSIFPWPVINLDVLPTPAKVAATHNEFTIHFPPTSASTRRTAGIPETVALEIEGSPVSYRIDSFIMGTRETYQGFYQSRHEGEWLAVDLSNLQSRKKSTDITHDILNLESIPISVTYQAVSHIDLGDSKRPMTLSTQSSVASRSSDESHLGSSSEEDEFILDDKNVLNLPKSYDSVSDMSQELLEMLGLAGFKPPIPRSRSKRTRDALSSAKGAGTKNFMAVSNKLTGLDPKIDPPTGHKTAHFHFYDYKSMTLFDLGSTVLHDGICLESLNPLVLSKINSLWSLAVEEARDLITAEAETQVDTLYTALKLIRGSDDMSISDLEGSPQIQLLQGQLSRTVDTLRVQTQLLRNPTPQLSKPHFMWSTSDEIVPEGTRGVLPVIASLCSVPQMTLDIKNIHEMMSKDVSNGTNASERMNFIVQSVPDAMRLCSVCGRAIPVELALTRNYDACSETCETKAILAHDIKTLIPVSFIGPSGSLQAASVPELVTVAPVGEVSAQLELLGHYRLAGFTKEGRGFWEMYTAVGVRRLLYNSITYRWEILGSLAVDSVGIRRRFDGITDRFAWSRPGVLAYSQKTIVNSGLCDSTLTWIICHREDPLTDLTVGRQSEEPDVDRVNSSPISSLTVYCHSKWTQAPPHVILGCGTNGILGVYQRLRVMINNAPFYVRASEHATHDYFCRTSIAFDSYSATWRLIVPTMIGTGLLPGALTGGSDLLACSAPTNLSTDPTISSWGPKQTGSYNLSKNGGSSTGPTPRFAVESMPYQSLWRPYVLTVQSDINNFPSGEYLLPRNAMDATLHFAASPESGVDEHVVHPRILLRILDLVGHLICLAPATHNIHDSFLIKLQKGTRECGYWRSSTGTTGGVPTVSNPNFQGEAKIIAMTELPSCIHVFGNGAGAALRGTYYLMSCLFNFRPMYIRILPSYADRNFNAITPITPEMVDELCGGNEVAATDLRDPLIFHYYSSTSETWRFGTKAGSGMAICESDVITIVHHTAAKAVRQDSGSQLSLEESIEEIHQIWKRKNVKELAKGILTASTPSSSPNMKKNGHANNAFGTLGAYALDQRGLRFKNCVTGEKMDILLCSLPHDPPVSTRRIVSMLQSPLVNLCAARPELPKVTPVDSYDEAWETTQESASTDGVYDTDVSEQWNLKRTRRVCNAWGRRTGAFNMFNVLPECPPKLHARPRKTQVSDAVDLSAVISSNSGDDADDDVSWEDLTLCTWPFESDVVQSTPISYASPDTKHDDKVPVVVQLAAPAELFVARYESRRDIKWCATMDNSQQSPILQAVRVVPKSWHKSKIESPTQDCDSSFTGGSLTPSTTVDAASPCVTSKVSERGSAVINKNSSLKNNNGNSLRLSVDSSTIPSIDSEPLSFDEIARKIFLTAVDKLELCNEIVTAFLEAGRLNISASDFSRSIQKIDSIKHKMKNLKTYIARHIARSSPFSMILRLVCADWLQNKSGLVSLQSFECLAKAIYSRVSDALPTLNIRENISELANSQIPFLAMLQENESVLEAFENRVMRNRRKASVRISCLDYLILLGQELSVTENEGGADAKRYLHSYMSEDGRISLRRKSVTEDQLANFEALQISLDISERVTATDSDSKNKENSSEQGPLPLAANSNAPKLSLRTQKATHLSAFTARAPSIVTESSQRPHPPLLLSKPLPGKPPDHLSKYTESKTFANDPARRLCGSDTYGNIPPLHNEYLRGLPSNSDAPPSSVTSPHPGWIAHPCVRCLIPRAESAPRILHNSSSNLDLRGELYEASTFKGLLLPSELLKHRRAVHFIHNLAAPPPEPPADMLILTTSKGKSSEIFGQKIGADLSLKCEPALLKRLRHIWNTP